MVPETISQSKPLPEPTITKRPFYRRASCLVGIIVLLLLAITITVGGFLYLQNTGGLLSPTTTYTVEATQPVIHPTDTLATLDAQPTDTAPIPPTLEQTIAPPASITPTYTAWPNTVHPINTP
jgi:hypothetical protein